MSGAQKTTFFSLRRSKPSSLLFTILLANIWSAFGLKQIPIANIQVVQKETANLPCDLSLADPRHDDVILVLWYREDLGRPIYSLDARDRSFQDAERWSDENVFGNRAYFRPNLRPAILAIENVQETDAAVYRCRVDFRVAQTRNAKVNLTVIVPPEQPKIHDETGKERKNLVGPYTEGSSLTLTCHVRGGKPPPRVIWYRNGKLIDSSDYYDEVDGAMKNELTVAILSRSDLHADLSCETSNNNVSTPLVTTVHVDMNFGPLEVKILDKSHQITAGRIYDIFCKAVGSRPQAVITWYLDGRRVEGGKEMTSKDGNATTSTLSYVPQKEDSGKTITCRAKNSAIPNINLEDSFTLQVMYLPIAQIKLGSSLKPDTIWEGTDLYFECHIEANPPVHKIDWRHNGKLLSHNKNSGVLISNQSLVLQKVTRLAAGNYTCIGRNTLGDGESQPFYLDILYSPACRPNQNRVHGVAKFENANITCDVDANPPLVKFRWTFNNSAESNEVPTSRYRSSGTRSIVTYTPMSELDYGTLLCWATNRIGDQRVPCVYHVIAAGRPDTVHNCTLANHSTDSFFLTCIEGFNGGLPQSFLLELVDSAAHRVRVNMTTAVPVFHVTGLEPGLSLQAHVYAFNNKGRSDPAVIPVFTLRLPEKILTREKEKPRLSQFEFSNTLKISIPIGVVAGLVLLSVVIISVRVYCSRRRSRERRRREKASTTPLKMDPPDGCDSDEKNPDVIPLDSDEVEYYRKRQQHISTIDTSPARVTSSGLPASYCTMRNGSIPLQDLNNIGARPKYMGGQETGYGTGFVGCPTLPRGHHHAHHATMAGVEGAAGHVSMEWPSYQGAAGISRRQAVVQHQQGTSQQGQAQAQPSPQTSLLSHVHHHQQHPGLQQQQQSSSNYATNPRLSSFRPTQQQQPQQISAGTSTGLPYDIPPLLGHPVLEDDVDLTEIPLMTDKIESTV